MTAYPSMKIGGGTVEMAPESAFGTAGTYVEQRLSDTDPTLPTKTRDAIDVPHTGHRHWGTRDAQVLIEKYQESALVIPTRVARATATGTGLNQTMQHFRAAGCNIATLTGDTTIASETDAGAFALTADIGVTEGRAAGIGLYDVDSGGVPDIIMPVLASAYSHPDFTPSMDMPTVTDTGYVVQMAHTATPRVCQLPATSTNAFRAINYDVHTAAQTGWIYTGCAVGQIADVVFEPLSPLEIVPTYHVTDVSGPNNATIATETFQDSPQFAIIGGQTACHCNLASFADPITTNTRVALERATWTPGIGCVPIPGFGTSGCINGIQGWQSVYTGSKIVLQLQVDKTYWSNYLAQTSDSGYYVAVTQPSLYDGTTIGTAVGLWLPKCRIYGTPTTELFSDTHMSVTVTFEPTTPAYEADEGVTSEGMAPWYFSVSGEGA